MNILDCLVSQYPVLSQAEILIGINYINQMMGYKRKFFRSRFSGANVQIAVNLPAINTHYLPGKKLGQMQGQSALADAGRTNDSYQLVHGLRITFNHRGLGYNAQELVCLQAGTPDQSPINLRLLHEFPGVSGSNTTAV